VLSTAVALNLEASKAAVEKGVGASSPAIQAMLGGQDPRHDLSAGAAAMPVDANGVPFDMSHIYASGNLAADMYANAAAESSGRLLAVRLRELTDDPGMKDMWSFLIARDTMHQQQWLAVVEELGGPAALPIPNSFQQEEEKQESSYTFMNHGVGTMQPPVGRWSEGTSIDGRGEFRVEPARPLGTEPVLSSPGAFSTPERVGGLARRRTRRASRITPADALLGARRLDRARAAGSHRGTPAGERVPRDMCVS
jgi:Mn-containing catalase